MWTDRLSDVQTLRANEGWPAAACKQFVTRLDRRHAIRDVAFWAAISLGAVLSLNFVWRTTVPPTVRLDWWVIDFSLHVALVAVLSGLWFWRRRARLYRAVAEYRAAPWCLKCRYPIPAAAPAGAAAGGAALCPECGEPIPPEIATLAAERAKRYPHPA